MQIVSWIYLFVLTLGAWVIFSLPFAWSVFAGGVISILSFIVSHKDVIGFIESLTPADGEEIEEDQEENKKKVKRRKFSFIIKFWFRILVIGVVLIVLIKSNKINIFGLILGLSTVVFTVTFTAVDVARRYFFRRR